MARRAGEEVSPATAFGPSTALSAGAPSTLEAPSPAAVQAVHPKKPRRLMPSMRILLVLVGGHYIKAQGSELRTWA